MDVLVDERAIAGGEVLLFVDQEQRGIDVVGTRIQRGGVERQQQLDLVLDRHFHGIAADRRLPAHLTHRRRRCQLHRTGLDAGVGAGDCSGLLDRRAHRRLGLLMGGGKAPGTVDDHADAHAGGLGVHHVLHLVLAGDHELPQVAADAHVAVGGTGTARGLQGGVGQAFLQRRVEAGLQLLGGDHLAEEGGHDQPARGKPGQGQEVTSLQGCSPCRRMGGSSAETARGVDDVDAVEAGGGRTVRNRRDLAGLALAIEERTTQAEIAFIADGGAGVPELRRADLVSRVLDHAGDLSVLDLVVQLAAELRVVALLVDRIRTAAVDPDAVLHVLDHVLDAERLLARRQRDIGHALELHAGPGIGIAAAVRCVAAEDVSFIAGGLVIDQDAVAHQVPALGLHPFVVIADRAEAARLGLVGEEGDDVAAPAEPCIALVQRGEAGAGIVGFVAEHAVQFQRVADRLVDGQPGVRRVEHQVVLARLHRRCLQLLLRLFGGGDGVLLHVIGGAVVDHAVRADHLAGGGAIEVLVAQAHRRGQALTGTELAAGLVDRGDRHRCPDAMHVLVDVGAIGGGEVLLLVDQEQHRIDEAGTGAHRGGVDIQQQVDLV
ncbi:hypothetical protein G6F65_013571 [Rhizopus arrhizus]|nr:hypothetical protein G6F65_013571 [Rhizopus arrhizus]